jgi:hypothetical protein
MGLSVCPAAVVAAPVEVVWRNLVQWERYLEWADVRVQRCEPEGPATAGQTVCFGPRFLGRILHFTFKVKEVDPERHQLGGHAFFPLGLQEKAHIACSPIDATTCRVQYG